MYVKILLPPPIRIQDTIKPCLAIIGSILNIQFQVNMIYLTKDLMLLLLGLEN